MTRTRPVRAFRTKCTQRTHDNFTMLKPIPNLAIIDRTCKPRLVSSLSQTHIVLRPQFSEVHATIRYQNTCKTLSQSSLFCLWLSYGTVLAAIEWSG
jgi:hypothetical protein